MSAPFQYTNNLGSTPAPAAPGGFGGAGDWATIISGVGQGISNAYRPESKTGTATNSREAREAKRRTMQNLLGQAQSRYQGINKLNQQYGDEMNDFQRQAMQQVARGFVAALQGSSTG